MIHASRYDYADGFLRVLGEQGSRTYARPCDWAADCGPETFLGGPRPWTAAARVALEVSATAPSFKPLRGLPDDFLVFATGLDDSSPIVCGVACGATTLTVRFEDVWSLLPAPLRSMAYTCDVTRDPHAKDVPQATVGGVIRETLHDLAPDVRICLDVAENGGFRLMFRAMP